jgi:hypothetical protein
MATTEIIPRIDEDGLVKTSADIKNLKLELAPLEEHIKGTTIRTELDYTLMGDAVVRVKDNQKKREWLAAPFKSILATIKQRIDGMGNVDDCKDLIKLGKQKMSDWRVPEKEASAEEQDEINRKRAKQGLPPIEVKPNIPKIPGLPARTNYHAECVDFDKLLEAYRKTTTAVQRTFLRQFLAPHDQNIGKFARDTKDDAATMKAIPGVKAWHD